MHSLRYDLMINTDPDAMQYDDAAPIEVGKIIDTLGQTPTVTIFYDKFGYLTIKNRMAISIHEFPDGSKQPIIRINKDYRDLMYEKPQIFRALAMHELGHYVNDDLDAIKSAGLTSQSVRAERTSLIEQSKVSPEEAAADRFAVENAGKSRFINALDYLIATRRKRNDPAMALAIREFESRKKAVQRLK